MPSSSPLFSRWRLVTLCLALQAGVSAQETQAQAPVKPEAGQAESGAKVELVQAAPPSSQSNAFKKTYQEGAKMVQNIMGLILPTGLEKRRWEVDFEPRIGDLLSKEYIRYPLEVRYGATDNIQVYGRITPVSPNPFIDGPGNVWSLGEGKLGVSYVTPKKILFSDRTVFGFEVLQPLGHPPVEQIDHYTHLRPYVTFTFPYKPISGTTIFLSMLYDQSMWSHETYDQPPDYVRTNYLEVSPGFLYKPGQLGYLVQYTVRFQEKTRGDFTDHYTKVGLVWEVPEERSKRWSLPGKWQLEGGLKIRIYEETGDDIGLYGRVLWKGDFFRKKWEQFTK